MRKSAFWAGYGKVVGDNLLRDEYKICTFLIDTLKATEWLVAHTINVVRVLEVRPVNFRVC